MRLSFNYLKLQYKRLFRVFCKTFASTLFLLLSVIILMYFISTALLKTSPIAKVKVAIAIEEGEHQDSTLLITDMLQSMESIQNYCEFIYVSESEALDLLNKEEIIAFVYLPDNIYEDINHGTNTPIKIISSPAASAAESSFFQLIVNGVNLLSTSEAGVYAAYDFFREYTPNIKVYDAANQIALLYAGESLARFHTYNAKIVTATGNFQLNEYYFASGILIIILLQGICFSVLFKKENSAVEEALATKGIKGKSIMALNLWVMTSIVFAILLLSYFYLIWGNFVNYPIYFNFMTIIGLLFVSISISSMFLMVFSIADGNTQSLSFLMIFLVILILLSGIAIPLVYFPKSIQNIAGFLPLQIWHKSILQLFFDDITAKEIIGLNLSSVVMLSMGGIMRCKRN